VGGKLARPHFNQEAMHAGMHLSSQLGRGIGKRIIVQGQHSQTKNETPLKNKLKSKKRLGGMAQVVECLPSKCKTLSTRSWGVGGNIYTVI
jgi:hypothetical protein